MSAAFKPGVVSVAYDGAIAVITIDNPPVNTIDAKVREGLLEAVADTIGLKTLLDGMLKYRAIFGPMHWEPAPMLVKLVREGKSLAQWESERR